MTTRCWKKSSAVFLASHKFSEIEMCFRDSSALTKCWQDPNCQTRFLSACLSGSLIVHLLGYLVPGVTTLGRCWVNYLWAAGSRLPGSTACPGQVLCSLLQRMDRDLILLHSKEEEKIIIRWKNSPHLRIAFLCTVLERASCWQVDGQLKLFCWFRFKSLSLCRIRCYIAAR